MNIIIISVFFLALCSLLLALFPLLLPNSLNLFIESSNLIAYAQVTLEVSSLAALIFAAWEFIRSRQKPDLKIWLQPVENSNNVGSPKKSSDVSWAKSGLGNKQGILYEFKFRLLLGNAGKAAATYVKVVISRDDWLGEEGHGWTGSHFQRLSEEPPAGHWVPKLPRYDKPTHVYHGGADFISYAHKKSIPDNRDLLDDLGLFEIHVPAKAGDIGPIQQKIKI